MEIASKRTEEERSSQDKVDEEVRISVPAMKLMLTLPLPNTEKCSVFFGKMYS